MKKSNEEVDAMIDEVCRTSSNAMWGIESGDIEYTNNANKELKLAKAALKKYIKKLENK